MEHRFEVTSDGFNTHYLLLFVPSSKSYAGICAYRAFDMFFSSFQVQPDLRGLGLGSSLLEEAKRRWGSMSLYATHSQPWIVPFYQRHGFVIVKRYDNATSMIYEVSK